jgi:hypothetical protein
MLGRQVIHVKIAAPCGGNPVLAFVASPRPAGSAESRYCRRLWTLQ